MKLLHVVPSFGLGGMEKVICTFIKHTTPTYQHSILTLDNNMQAGVGCKTRKCNFSTLRSQRSAGGFSRLLPVLCDTCVPIS